MGEGALSHVATDNPRPEEVKCANRRSAHVMRRAISVKSQSEWRGWRLQEG